MKTDRAVGIATVVAGARTAFASANIGTMSGGGTLSARFFPYLLAAVLMISGAALTLAPGPAAWAETVRRLVSYSAVWFGGAFVVYALVFAYLDYRLSTWLFVLAAMWLLGVRRKLELLIVPIAVSLVTFYLFRYGFAVLLPTWS